jgi:hypothetical protein
MAVVLDSAALLPADAPVALQTSFSGSGGDGTFVPSSVRSSPSG